MFQYFDLHVELQQSKMVPFFWAGEYHFEVMTRNSLVGCLFVHRNMSLAMLQLDAPQLVIPNNFLFLLHPKWLSGQLLFSVHLAELFSTIFFSFFGGGGGGMEEEEEQIVKGDEVIVELDASLEDLYMGGSLKVTWFA